MSGSPEVSALTSDYEFSQTEQSSSSMSDLEVITQVPTPVAPTLSLKTRICTFFNQFFKFFRYQRSKTS